MAKYEDAVKTAAAVKLPKITKAQKRAVFVRMEQRHVEILVTKAAEDGCSVSDLVRKAAISFFHLPVSVEWR